MEEFETVTLRDPSSPLTATYVPIAGMVGTSLSDDGVELLGQRRGLQAYVSNHKTMGIPILYPWANRLSSMGYGVDGAVVTLTPGTGGVRTDEHGDIDAVESAQTRRRQIAAARAALANAPGVVLVDEAFVDAVPGECESLLDGDLAGLLVVRSLTKTWAVAGIRAGDVVGAAEPVGLYIEDFGTATVEREAIERAALQLGQRAGGIAVPSGGAGRCDLPPQRRGLVEHALRLLTLERGAAALVVDRGLRGELFGGGDVELAVEDRVAGRVFVHVGGAVADPLAGDEDRQLDVELDLAHLERGRVPVPHQVADQPLVVRDRLGAAAIADAGRLHDGRVVAHVVDDPDQPVVEHRDGVVQPRLHPFADRAQGGTRRAAILVDLGLLFGRQGHGGVLSGSHHIL